MRHRPLLLAALFLPLPGCCSLARLFCGPDRSTWVSERYDTPPATVATFLEAIRRDDPEVVVTCLSAGLRARHHLDALTAQLGWQQLRDQTPGLHLAGYATIPAPTSCTDDAATFVLDVEGRSLRLDLVRETFVEILWRRPNGSLGGNQRPLAWSPLLRLEPVVGADPRASRLVVAPLQFDHEGAATVPAAAFERIALGQAWKIAALQLDPAR